jgi:hypothetical protein
MKMLWIQNFWITAICVPYIIIIKSRPDFPPSLVALEVAKEAPFCENIKQALLLPNYVKLVCTFALM